MSLVTPLAVSVCTAKTATISSSASARSTCSTAAASIGSPSRQGVRTTRRPSASTWIAHWSEKWPVPGINTRPSGGNRFSIATSHAPWPLVA